MRQILKAFMAITALAFAFSASAQTGRIVQLGSARNVDTNALRGSLTVDSFFRGPIWTDTPTFMPAARARMKGAEIFRTEDGHKYVFSGVKWEQASGNAGGSVDMSAVAAAISSALDTNNATTSNDTIAAASAYNSLPTTPNNNGGTHYLMNTGRQTRIRQDGVVRAVQFYVGDVTGLSSFQIIIARNTGGIWSEVGRSENIASKMTASSMNKITLSSPISGVKEGDYVGYASVVSGATNLLCGVTGQGSSFFTQTDPSTSFDWTGSGTELTSVFPIRCFMDAPMLASISNSIMAGWPANRTYIEVEDVTDYDNTVPYLLKGKLGITVQNMGWAGQQTHSMLARFQSDVLDANPRLAMIEGGINDLGGYDVMGEEVYNHTAAQVIANLDSMYARAHRNGIIPIAILILPATTQTNTAAIKADSVNAHIQTVIAGYGGFYVDLRSAMGVFRAGGPEGNHWDANAAYFVDGVHFTHAGAALAAQIIADSISSHYSFSRTTGYVKFTDLNTAFGGIALAKNGEDLTLSVGTQRYTVSIPATSSTTQVSVPVDTTAPDSANLYINSLDRTLRYIISDTEYVVQVASKIPLIAAGPEAITFPTATDLTESPSGTWQATTIDAAFGHTGLSDKKLAAGTDGMIYTTFVSGSTDSNPFGFNTANAQTLWGGMEAGVIAANGDLYAVDNGTLSGAIYTMPNGSLYGIRRSGSTLTAEVFNGSTWVVKYTFTFSSAADLYIVTDLPGTANHVLVDPTGIGLQ